MTIRTRSSIAPEIANTATWVTVDRDSLDAEARAQFERNETAMIRYFQGEAVNTICGELRFARSELFRLRNRCLKVASDGRAFGFRACLPYYHIEEYVRTKMTCRRGAKNGGFAGMLGLLFRTYPELREYLVKAILAKGDVSKRCRDSLSGLHTNFLKQCKRLGIASRDYPFNTKDLAANSVREFLHQIEAAHPFDAAGSRFGDDSKRKVGGSGRGFGKLNVPQVPVALTQCDGHKIDGYFTILVPHPKGGFLQVVVERLWLLIVIDVLTRAVLGYHIAFGKNYGAEDVLKCIRNAIVPWTPRKLTIPNLDHTPASGIPSGIYPEMEWAVWSEIQLDGAMANLANEVKAKLTQSIGCACDYGAPASPEGRQIIERFFKTFEEAGVHRMPNTTGSNPSDARRNQPEKMAKHYGISLDYLDDIAEVTICNYNATPHSGLAGRSPLEQIEYCLKEQKAIIPVLDESQRRSLDILEYRMTVIVRGNLENGIRPYVNFHNERYTNGVLSSGFHFVGEKITLVVDRGDISSVRAFLSNGESLGILCAQGLWRGRPHSLFVRKSFDALRKNRKLAVLGHSDPVAALQQHWEREAPISVAAATKLAKLHDEIEQRKDRPKEQFAEPNYDPDVLPVLTEKRRVFLI